MLKQTTARNLGQALIADADQASGAGDTEVGPGAAQNTAGILASASQDELDHLQSLIDAARQSGV